MCFDQVNIFQIISGVCGATDQYLAGSLVRELRWGQLSVQAREQETCYIEALGDHWAKEEEKEPVKATHPSQGFNPDGILKHRLGGQRKTVELPPPPSPGEPDWAPTNYLEKG